MSVFCRFRFIAVFALMAAGCSSKTAPLESMMHTEGLHHKWTLLKISDTTAAAGSYIDLRDVYRSGAWAGCRYFSFTPKFGRNNRMQIANIAAHLSDCPHEGADPYLRSALESVYSFSVTHNQLRLLSKGGAAVFLAEKAAGDEGNTLARRWLIVQMINADNEQLVKDKSFLDLAGTGKAQGAVGCNRYSFKFTADDTYQITLSNIESTEMYCQRAAANESVFSKLLPLVSKYQVIGNRLKLFDKDNVLLLEGRSELM